MLLVIHNLPKEVSSSDVRQLIQQQCGLGEVILDNLQDEGPGKRITVGLAEEEDATILMQKLNGLHYKKCQLYVEDLRKKKINAPSNPFLIPAGLQPQTQRPWIQYPVPNSAPTLQVNNSNMPYYMTQGSNNMNFGEKTDSTTRNMSVFNRNNQYEPVQAPKAQNIWGYPLPGTSSNKVQTSNNQPSFESYRNDRDKQGDNRDNTSQPNWRENKSPPSKRHENFGNFSHRESTRLGDKSSGWYKITDTSIRRVDDRSPPRSQTYRQNKKDDRRDVFDTSRRSPSSRSNTRVRDGYSKDRQSDREQNNLFGRQSERVFDQHERRDDRKRIYEQTDRPSGVNVERPERLGNVSKTSTTFSSKPDNSGFSKPNKAYFNKTMGTGGFGETVKEKVQFPCPKQGPSNPQVNFPAAKRPRFESQPQHFGNKKYVNPNGPFSIATDYQKMMTRHTNWRIQSATLLAKEVLKNASNSKLDNTMFKTMLKKLRECILLRLDVILGDRIAANLDEILRGYRSKFNDHDDITFFKAVMEKVEREKQENADEVTGHNVDKNKQQQNQESGKLYKGPNAINTHYSPSPGVSQEKQQQHPESGKIIKGPSVVNPSFLTSSNSTVKPNLSSTGPQKGLISQNVPKRPFLKDPKTMPRLPRYPNSDKLGYKQFQKNALLEFEEGFYSMEPEFDVAVNEEVEKLVECYINACDPSSNKDENTIRNKIITSSADEFKNIIKLHVTKRVLNVTDGLTLRIFSTPKPPPKAALDAFLKKHGAISLKKSETTKMFVANCDSYESYDKLLAMQTTSFGNITIHIKPFHVLGPVSKKNKRTNKTVNTVQDFTKDVEETGIDLTSDDTDVILVENEQSDVVVIRDDLDKSIDHGNKENDDVNDQDINTLKSPHSNDKIDDSNIKVGDSNDKVASKEKNCNLNDKVDASNVEVVPVNEKVNTSNQNDNCETKSNDSNERIENSDDRVSVKIEDSSNNVPDLLSTEQINISEKNLESIDDILNEADEILEDDLEDF